MLTWRWVRRSENRQMDLAWLLCTRSASFRGALLDASLPRHELALGACDVTILFGKHVVVLRTEAPCHTCDGQRPPQTDREAYL